MLDSERAGETHDGHPDRRHVDDALAFEPTIALVGVATQGGRFPPAWRELLRDASRGASRRERAARDARRRSRAARARRARGVELRDLRRPPPGLDCPTGEKLEVRRADRPDRRLGVRDREDDGLARARPGGAGARPRLAVRPDRQTGIAIAGWGIAVDAVVADFLAGAAERLVVEGPQRGGELLWVEGQGSIVHPAYSGVTLGLFHGSAPHALVLCHRPARRRSRATPVTRSRPSPISSSCTSGCRCPRAGPGRGDRAQHPRPRRRGRREPRSRPPRARPACPRTTRSASGRSALLDAVLAARSRSR